MQKFTIRVCIEDENNEYAVAERHYIAEHHTAPFGWCVGETTAAAIESMSDVLARRERVLKDVTAGFCDGMSELLRKENR